MTTHYKLYNGTVNLEFNEDTHRYKVDGEWKQGVTTILGVISKPFLIPWAVNMACEVIKEKLKAGVALDEVQIADLLREAKGAHTKKKEQAADLGTLIHNWCEQYTRGNNPARPLNTDMNIAIDKFLIWQKEHNVVFTNSEEILYSKKYSYCGKADFICLIDGKRYIGDFKTGANIFSEHFLQTAAYQQARQEEYPDEQYDGNLILHISKVGEFKDERSVEYEKNRDAFNNALALSRRMKELDKIYKKY